MRIRPATNEDIPTLMRIYANARAYMREHGNEKQWIDGYPKEELIRKDLAEKQLYVCEEEKQIAGVFCYFYREEPTYAKIYAGQWLNTEPYGVVHRIASAKNRHGIASFCLQWCLQQCGNLKIDTHRDNYPMQNALNKNGFCYCGIIYLADGAERLAYQKKLGADSNKNA